MTVPSTQSPSQYEFNKLESSFNSIRTKHTYTCLSANGQLVAYVDAQNVLHIENLTTQKSLSTVSNSYPVDYIEWIGNDSVFVDEKQSGGALLLERVDANTGSKQMIHTFSGLLSSDDIVKIAYSTETNDTYVLVGNPNNTVVYHFDTNGNINSVNLGGRYIKNVAVSETGDTLYFEDYAAGSFNIGELPLNGQVNIMYRDRALVGVVGNTVYLGTINSSGLVTAVYTDQSVLVKTLHNPVKASDIILTNTGKVML